MADFRNVWVLIAAVTLLQLGGGILGVVTPLGLEALGAGSLVVGIVAALNAVGFMIGARYSAEAIRAFGNIRLYAAAAAVAAISILTMHLALNMWAWAGVRLVQGIALAFMFSSIEAWLGAAVPAAKRGSVGGFYHLMAKVALIIGPFFALGMSALDNRPYMWGAIFMALSLLPVCLTRRGEPPVPDTEPLSIRQLFKLAPSGVIAAFLAGVINTGTLALLPIYAVGALSSYEMSATGVAAMAAAFAWGGGLVSQWPAGKLSDRFDRRSVLAAMVGVAGFAAIGLVFGPALPPTLVLVLIAVWGAGSLSFYGVAVAHIIDWCPTGQIAQAMAGVLFVWATGSVIGPLLAGAIVRYVPGTGALFGLAAVLSFVMVAAMLYRRAARDEPPEAIQEPWSPTTPLLAAKGEVDPRSE
jgi:MFS family permease